MKWHEHIPERKVINIPAINMDIFSTILFAAGIAKPKNIKIDGIDLMPVIEGKAKKTHDYFCWRYKGSEAARDKKWKYHKTSDGDEYLINLESDVSEENNVIDVYPTFAERLIRRLSGWKEEIEQQE